MYRIVLEVVGVPTKCAAGYKVGDRITVQDPNIILSKSTRICIYALSALIPYLTPLSRELSKEGWMSMVTELYWQDPRNSVRFKITRARITPKDRT